MAKKKKKSRKKRGSKTHGYGSKKKHRGKGSKGGSGKAGLNGHKKLKMLQERPDHFGKRGFKSLKQRNIKESTKAINLRDLQRLGEGEIDLVELGYDKVLGTGELEKPLTVKAKKFSQKAEEKIEKAGGKAIRYGDKGEDRKD